MDWFLYDIRLRHERVKSHVFHFRLFSAKTKKRQYLVIFNTFHWGFVIGLCTANFLAVKKIMGNLTVVQCSLNKLFFALSL